MSSSSNRATRYIVVGHYDCERNTCNSDHVVSRHNTSSAAWRAAERAHADLGGCDGSDSLATVMRRLDADERRSYRKVVRDLRAGRIDDYHVRISRSDRDLTADRVEEYEGTLYGPDNYWQAHTIVAAPGGLAAIVN